MKTSSAFPSKYLSADDLDGREITVTIESADMEEVGQKNEPKLVLSFRGKQKRMVVNRTNAKTIEKVLGSDETDDWIGQRIIIGPREVEFQGDMVLALRVSLKKPGQTVPPAKQKPTAPPPTDDLDPMRGGEDAEIPF